MGSMAGRAASACDYNVSVRASIIWAILLFVLMPAHAGWVILNETGTVASSDAPKSLTIALGKLPPKIIRCIALSGIDGFAILYDRNKFVADGIPESASAKLRQLADANADLRSIAFAPGGGWIILYDQNSFAADAVPPEMLRILDNLKQQKTLARQVSFTIGGGWTILSGKSGYSCRNIPDDAFRRLGEIAKRGSTIDSIAFDANGGWTILFDNSQVASAKIPDVLSQKLTQLSRQGTSLTQVAFTSLLLDLSKDDGKTRAAVEERMEQEKVRGLSIAVIENGKILFARGYGVTETGGKPVTDLTRFQAGSVSKPVAALAAMRLVEQGKLTLDDDFNQFLTSWKIPHNTFTAKKVVTLREILTHTAGFTVHGFEGYVPTAPRPGLIEVLNGVSPANSPPIIVNQAPGAAYRYSGGGFCVMQQGMLDVTGSDFPDLMSRLVLSPLEMKNSTYDLILPGDWQSLAAIGHSHGQPIPGKWHVYPESAAAGLWTTPSDLARFIIAVQQAWRGVDGPISHDIAIQMLTPQSHGGELSLVLSGSGKDLCFQHDGLNAGFRSLIIGFPRSGQGAAIMINDDSSATVLEEITASLVARYHWPAP